MEPVARRPRNPRLSAYYGLQHNNENPRILSSPGTPNVQSSEDGSWAANDLIKRLPLAQLVRTSTKIRNDAERIERSLHGSVKNCYAQLDEAAVECSKITKITSALGKDNNGAIQGIASACQKCKQISAEMQPMREKIENLEESRRVMLLFRAAGLLAKLLPDQFSELTELCTDPQRARDRLFLTAHRCSIIAPQLERLSSHDQSFAEAHAQLSTAISDVVTELHSQLREEHGSLEGLSLADVMRIRIYLRISDENLRTFFLNTGEAILQSKKPSSEVIRIASRSKLSLAAFHLRHAANVMLEDIKCISAAYDDVFRGDDCFVACSKKMAGESYSEDSILSSDAFTLWMSSTVDEHIGTAVRRALANAPGESTSDIFPLGQAAVDVDSFSVDDVAGFKESVSLARKASQIDAGSSGTSLGQVPVIIGTLCDSICAQVQQAISGNVTVQIKSVVDRALFSEFDEGEGENEDVMYGTRDTLPTVAKLRSVVSAVQELVEKCNCLLEELSFDDTEDVLVTAEVGTDAIQSLRADSVFHNSIEVDIAGLVVQIGSDFTHRKAKTNVYCRALLRTAFMCNELGGVLRNPSLSKSLGEAAEMLQGDFTTRLVDDASDIFRKFILPKNSDSYLDRFVDGASVAAQIIDLLKMGRQEVDEYPAPNSNLLEVWKHVPGARRKGNGISLPSDESLDSGGVVHRIAGNWVQCIRLSSITLEKKTSVDRIVGDVGMWLEAVDIFEAVSRAANERCRTI